jgi:flagellar basal-body rod modification protein FlgD
MASAINPLGSSGSTTPTSSSSGTALSTPPSEQMFLTLLVSQLQNQDPMNPADSTQFVSQLAQFSELEQVIGIKQDIESYHTAAAAAAAAASNGTGTGNNTGSNGNGTNPASS